MALADCVAAQLLAPVLVMALLAGEIELAALSGEIVIANARERIGGGACVRGETHPARLLGYIGSEAQEGVAFIRQCRAILMALAAQIYAALKVDQFAALVVYFRIGPSDTGQGSFAGAVARCTARFSNF